MSHHKKSQSLYNNKITNILAGLQQSLGVIANNVKESLSKKNINQMINQKEEDSQKILESALLAKRLEQMTSTFTRIQDYEHQASKKKSNNKQFEFKTIDYSNDNKSCSRSSIEKKQSKICQHQRNKSDALNLRMKGLLQKPQLAFEKHQPKLRLQSSISFEDRHFDTESMDFHQQRLLLKSAEGIPFKNIHQEETQKQKSQSRSKQFSSARRNRKKSKNKKKQSTITISYSKEKKIPYDRLSDKKKIEKPKGQCQIIQVQEPKVVSSQLRSPASSPSLQNFFIKYPHSKNEFSQIQSQHKSKVLTKLQQNQINSKQMKNLKSNHKKSNTDCNQLSYICQFQKVRNSNKIQYQNKFNFKNIPTPNNASYVIYQHDNQQNDQKVQIVSHLNSQRVSIDEQNCQSPSLQFQNKITGSSNDMQVFLSKIKQKDLNALANQNNNQKKAFIRTQGTNAKGTRTTTSNTTTATLSFGSQINKNQKQQMQKVKQKSMLKPKKDSKSESQKEKIQKHKRANSDTHQFLIDPSNKQNQLNSMKVNTLNQMKNYKHIVNQDKIQPYSARESPLQAKQSNETLLLQRELDFPTNNQNVKKGAKETYKTKPQLGILLDNSSDEKYNLKNDYEQDRIESISIYHKMAQQIYGQDVQEMKMQSKISTINQSPKLRIIPTPKAIQPNIQYEQTHQDQIFANGIQSTQVKDSQKQNNDCQDKDKNLFQTFESNITLNNNYSPKTKDRLRIQKKIQISFNKVKEPIKTTSDFYRIGRMLGRGAFGRVNLAVHKICQELVAVKSINKQILSQDEESKRKLMQEMQILQKIRHENIVKLYDSFETKKHIVFVMELCSGGDLLNYVRKRRRLKEEAVKFIFKQVVEGLYYCHAKQIVHRDIKLDNLLLTSDGKVKICDFGVSKHVQDLEELMFEQCGTPAYIAPEIIKDKGYQGFGADMWSLGVCLYAMFYGTVPFKANNMTELHQLILQAKYQFKDDKVDISSNAKDLIKCLLEPNPKKRITIQEVKEHKWLQTNFQLKHQKIEVFSQEEQQKIIKDFTYQDLQRINRNCEKQSLSTENLFTEHGFDSTENCLIKNQSTKSIILAPFNSTITNFDNKDDEGNSILAPLDFDQELLLDKKVIKYANRVKDINRQYELNNNQELDNGVYNKFIKESTNRQEKEQIGSEENSFQISVNLEQMNQGPKAPLVTQNSEEEIEAELIIGNKEQQQSELLKINTEIKVEVPIIEEQEIVIDDQIISKVQQFGYPKDFIIQSIQNYQLNDATTCYFLIEKQEQSLIDRCI